jgi:hypothetical protein
VQNGAPCGNWVPHLGQGKNIGGREDTRNEADATRARSRSEGIFVGRVAVLDDDGQSASVFVNELDGAPQVSVLFTPSGANDFTRLTRRLVQRRLAIVLDERLASAPLVPEEIPGGRAVITPDRGRFGAALEAEASALAVSLDVGEPPGRSSELQRVKSQRQWSRPVGRAGVHPGPRLERCPFSRCDSCWTDGALPRRADG